LPEEALVIDVSKTLRPISADLLARIAHLFDLRADPVLIDEHLAAHGLEASVAREPGVRVPGAFDVFELVLRAVLGQQVTVKGATTLMSRLTAAFGAPVVTGDAALTYVTPTPERLAAAGVAAVREIGLPVARATTIVALAERAASGTLALTQDAEPSALTSELTSVSGIGPWTAQYVTMRAAHWTDAFPASDIALRRAAGDITAVELSRVAERWRPFRAYAAMRLWLHGSVGVLND
jgi:AraC family transcriptional regulator of adaptative response / DNA-3-methyladenine glycosylase II